MAAPRHHFNSYQDGDQEFSCGASLVVTGNKMLVVLTEVSGDIESLFPMLATRMKKAFLSATAPNDITWVMKSADKSSEGTNSAFTFGILLEWVNEEYVLVPSIQYRHGDAADFWQNYFGSQVALWEFPNFAHARQQALRELM